MKNGAGKASLLHLNFRNVLKNKNPKYKKKTAQLTGRRRPRDDLAPKVVGARERARQQLADRRRLGAPRSFHLRARARQAGRAAGGTRSHYR